MQIRVIHLTPDINIFKMFMNIKKIIDLKVDIKSKISSLLLLVIFTLFPLNQQYHFRPFPSVDGIIIDYLILKVSLMEIILILYFLFNLKEIYNSISSYIRKIILILVLLLSISIFQSNYIRLALYENFIILIFFVTAIYLYKNPNLFNKKLLIKTMKFWLFFLLIVGIAQFFSQGAVFNNYALTGEFPYTEDHYHIKQKNPILGDLIPPYGIFSHSNIFGAYVLFLLIFLRNLGVKNWYYSTVVLLILIFIGSAACFLAFIVYQISTLLCTARLIQVCKLFFIVSIGVYFMFSYRFTEYQSDFSIYRRLYMFDLSSIKFLESAKIFWFGSGYYNYFFVVKEDLYLYELVRFFQPPHFAWNLIIWQYGFLFLIFISYLFWKFRYLLTKEVWQIILIFIVLFSFDHYLVTNHQLKFLIFLLIPYSLNPKNSVI